MYLYPVVLFLLSWPYARGSIDLEEQDVHLQDQVAVASQDTTRTLKTAKNSHIKDPIFFEGKQILDSTTVHYENSNGFIPITPTNRQRETLNLKNKNITEKDIVDSLNSTSDGQNKIHDDLENDPAYSTEARFFLSLAQNLWNRRSFDTEENPDEFELLKVKNDTPAVANYQEFYEKYQTDSSRADDFDNNSGRSYVANYERDRKPPTNIRDRVRNIQNYMTSYTSNVQHPSGNPYDRFYSYNNLKDSQMKDNHQHEKVHNNYYAQDSHGYGDQRGSGGSRQTVAPIPLKINYDTTETVKKPKLYSVREPSSTVKNRHRNSKPVIVVEPSDYKMNVKIGSQSTRSQASVAAPYKTSSSASDSVQDDSAKHYAHEALFNRDDGHHYDRTEESKDFSEENAEYFEITERPRKVHKSRRRPYVSETSRRLPKEHRGITEEIFEAEVPKKRPNASKSKAHRHRPKSNIWIDEDNRSQLQEESSEERNYDARAKGRFNVDITDTKFQNSKSNAVNSWTHLTPNLEISHSSGIEIDQIEKPKLIVPVKVNLVPLGKFDHATALGNSQGFDISNAVLQNFVTANPVINTVTPVVNTPQSVISHNLPPQNTQKNVQNVQNHNYVVGTPASAGSPVSDVIVGQSSFHNPIQAVLVPEQNVQSKYSENLRPQYVHSTVSPVYAVTSSGPSSLQNIPVSNFQSSVTPRPTYTATANIASNVQPMAVNQAQGIHAGPHIVISQATQQPFANYAQANGPFPLNQNIQVNSNGLHGQNLISNENRNAQTVQIASTIPNPHVISNINLLTAESQTKRQQTSLDANGQYFTSAGHSVSNNGQKHTNGYENNGNFYLQSNVPIIKPQLHENFYQSFRDDNLTPRIKTYVQNAHLAPTQVLQHAGNLNNLNFNNPNAFVPTEQNVQNFQNFNFSGQKNRDQNQQILKAANDIFENTLKQLQQLQKSQNVKTNRAPNQSYRTNDNVGSNSIQNSANAFSPTSGNFARAQLPNVGRQNVEILNPNIKPSPIDLTLFNPFESIGNYPTLLSTPIPIYSTSFAVTSKPILSTTVESIGLQKYVDSLTEIGAKANSAKLDLKGSASQNHGAERPLFNPINFVPNVDLIKNQRLLNSKLALNEPLLHNLNLVPLVPGGNFFKNSFGSHTDLFNKPKLTSDLEKYAEEMFKESLKTIYNSQKWNNDRQAQQDKNITDSIEVSKLKNEMLFKNSFPDIKQSKEILEAHFSENKLRAVDVSKQSEQKKNLNDAKKTESQNVDVDQLFKNDFKIHSPESKEPIHIYYDRPQNGPNRPPSDLGQSIFGNGNSNDYRNKNFPNHFLTPPKPNSFISKSPFHDKVVKKRPGPGQGPNPLRFNNFEKGNSRPISRPNGQKPFNSDVAASNNLGIHVEGPRFEAFQGRPPYESDNGNFESRPKPYSDYSQNSKDFTTYPTLTTSTPELEHFASPNKLKKSNHEIYDINHPRTQNLLGLLMKNKQLPSGNSENYFRDRDELKHYFENEKRRLQLQFYDDSLKNFQKKSDKSEAALKAKLPNNERKNS
ncbi:protein PF14_0175-like [Cephus cinctus]|uniref:Protein PF14_0175-like n=1 Tax=Cephus cinctus TaxID=211228 RepID=A0AAJ7W0K7_CEPCN|nr:protein PF14_0175-like [Cephus cinctus]